MASCSLIPPAMDQLQEFLQQRQEAHEPVADLDAFAQELPRRAEPITAC